MFGVVLPYHTAYIKNDNPTYSNALIYSTLVFMDLGLFFANQLLQFLEKCMGILNLIRLCGVLVFLSMLIFINFTNIYMVFLGFFLVGITHQTTTFIGVFILTVKYKPMLVKYTGIVFSGSSIAYLFWGVLSKIVSNPNNYNQTEHHMTTDGIEESFFPQVVAERFPIFCWIYGMSNLIIAMIISFFIKMDDQTLNESSFNDLSIEGINQFKSSFYSQRYIEARNVFYEIVSSKSRFLLRISSNENNLYVL